MKLMMAKKMLIQETILAHEIYLEKLKNSWLGLSTEVKEICKEIGINNINEKEVNKEEIEEAIYYHNYKEMKIEVNSYKKLEEIKNDNFTELPKYMNDKVLKMPDWHFEKSLVW